MAQTLNLTDGTTTHDLIGATYTARAGTLNMGNPTRQQVESSNIFGSRWDLIAHQFTKRVISMGLYITASDIDDLSTAIQNINKAITAAKENAISNIGNPWKVTWNPGGNALNVTFRIQNGYLTIPPTAWTQVSAMQTSNPYIANAVLSLECDPFGEGAEETILNYVKDPSFEVAGTALADWTEAKDGDHTVTTTRITTDAYYGNACLQIALTNSTGSGSTSRDQIITATAGEVWSIGGWYKITAQSGSNGRIRIRFQWQDSGGGVISQTSTDVTTGVTADWTQIKKENQTAPSNTVSFKLSITGTSDSSGGTVTVLWDGIIAVKAASIPTAWVSSSTIANHLDDAAQAHTNYIDVHPTLGDIPAAIQLKYAEDQAHTALWAGARHGTRQYDAIAGFWHEAEDFDSWTLETSDGDTSGGVYARHMTQVQVDNTSTGVTTNATSITEAHTVAATTRNTCLIAIVHAKDGTGAYTVPETVVWSGDEAFTKLNDQSQTIGAYTIRVSIWYRANPTAETSNVVATMGGTADEINIGVISCYNVDQTTPMANGEETSGTGTSVSDAVTSALGDLVVMGISADTSTGAVTMSIGSGETERYDVQTTALGNGGFTEPGGDGSTTMSPTLSRSEQFVACSGAIKAAGVAGTAAAPLVATKSISSPPRGTYRALVRAKDTSDAWAVAMGYAYGGVTQDPSVAGHYTALNTGYYTWLDVGSLVIPPTTLPTNSTLGAFTLRLAYYRTSGSGESTIDFDAVMLMPADFGSNYVSKASAQNVVVLDSISPQSSLSLWDTSDVFQSRPQQEGTVPYIDPAGSRIYFLVDDTSSANITHGGQVSVVIRPRYLVIG